MTTAENSALYYEAGQTFLPMTELTDSGDHKIFNSDAECRSDEAGFSPVVKPDGVLTGLVVSAAAGNNRVDVSAGTLNLDGFVVSLASGTGIVCTRGTDTDINTDIGTDVCVVNSVVVTGTGAIAVISGTAGGQLSEVRGVDGGPPFIPIHCCPVNFLKFIINN